MKVSTKAHLAVLCTNFIFGVNYSVIKFISPSRILPLGLNMSRAIVAFVLFWIIYFLKPSSNPIGIDKKDIPRFIICAASGVVINQIFFVKGLSLTSPIHASLLALITPIIIVIIAAWMLKEKLSRTKIIGLALGITGATILILTKSNSSAKDAMLWGDICVIVNAISYSFFMVWVHPLMNRYKPIHVVRWIFTFGFIMLLPFAWNDLYITNWQQFTSPDWVAMIIVCVGATFLSYLFNVYGISIIGSSATGSYIYTQPIFAAAIAIIFMGEILNINKIIAALLIFAGVYMVNSRKKVILNELN